MGFGSSDLGLIIVSAILLWVALNPELINSKIPEIAPLWLKKYWIAFFVLKVVLIDNPIPKRNMQKKSKNILFDILNNPYPSIITKAPRIIALWQPNLNSRIPHIGIKIFKVVTKIGLKK